MSHVINNSGMEIFRSEVFPRSKELRLGCGVFFHLSSLENLKKN